MRVTAIIVGLLMVAIPSSVFAETSWVRAGGNENFTAQVDVSRVRRTGNIVRYWVKNVHKISKEGWDYDIGIEEADCVSEQSRTLQFTVYFKNGTNRTVEADRQWRFVTPESVHESIVKFVCAL